MERFEQILTIASACVGLIITFTGFLIPLVKNIKAKNKLIALNKLSSEVQKWIVEAEKFTNFSGEEKKTYVLTNANRYALNNKICFDEQDVSSKVEELVSLSKKVNVEASKKNVLVKTPTEDKYKIC